jgi:hypothetical protein
MAIHVQKRSSKGHSSSDDHKGTIKIEEAYEYATNVSLFLRASPLLPSRAPKSSPFLLHSHTRLGMLMVPLWSHELEHSMLHFF